ncbi:SF0329 family protein [Ureibacillus acetophenoni]|uniref:Uncharacterized protein n=1 Tax=Ureibacillus acetophenoni TaxID=614649 RepID=A0A285URZ1_9BACL|nr:nonribosomal peptide synthetase [Ureibacillus acetophenoni]SOC44624.1 hypothetical protein SAMN05877842_12220 [Ureibacillus acetophenoni]
MQFSKLKKTIESFLCDTLKDRVEIHVAVYRQAHDAPSRIYITFDKKIIFSADDVQFNIAHYKKENDLKKQLQLKPIPYSSDWKEMFNSPERMALIEASEKAENDLLNQGLLASWHVYRALMNYPSLSINDALASKDIFTRSFALFDRRLGKRRIISLDDRTHPIEKLFYSIRCSADEINGASH